MYAYKMLSNTFVILYFLLIVLAESLSVNAATNNTCKSISGTQKNTSDILAALRREMQNAQIGIYVIFNGDEHGSTATQPYDKRRDWISGFRGSAGTAVVTLTSGAALWTDDRYFTQAEEELDCENWLLMREGLPDVPSLISWLVTEANRTALPSGATPEFSTTLWWSAVNAELNLIGKQLYSVGDLVGRIWTTNGRPAPSAKPIVIHDLQYAGETVAQKLNKTAAELKRYGATTAIISTLDEIAWLFNLRGADIPYNPLFKSYAIVHVNFLVDQPELFVNKSQLNGITLPGVRIFEYVEFWSRLNVTVVNTNINKIWANHRLSQAIFNAIPNEKLLQPLQNSPILRVKAKKNEVERNGMRQCQIRDAVARMKHLGWLEEQLNNDIFVNETQSVEQLTIYLQEQTHFKFPSFSTISAAGDRAAIIHYSPEQATARRITKDKIYLLDAGSQYLDCTTDITRTHHFGTPTSLEKRAYTRVLQGVLDLGSAIFPTGTYGRSLDHLGRMSLYRDGMIYGHVTGHGFGHYLRVAEGPQIIRLQYDEYEEPLADGMFVSNEPGFYKADAFGIRIENDVEIIMANKSTYDNTQYLRFDLITFLPYERSLIDVSLLTRGQMNIIDQYHSKVVNLLQPLLEGDQSALRALQSRTVKLNSTVTILSSFIINLIAIIFGQLFLNYLLSE
ncbi:hypothetical protein I4U23_015888 [Adineta vaga]|nr:hypothetical protein I4U23_015888 [Adineta vaga]